MNQYCRMKIFEAQPNECIQPTDRLMHTDTTYYPDVKCLIGVDLYSRARNCKPLHMLHMLVRFII